MDTQATNTAPSSAVTDWPGAFGVYKRASAAVKRNLWTILSLDVLVLMASFLSNGNQKDPNFILVFVGSLLSILFQIALVSAYLHAARDQEQALGDAIKAGAKNFVNGFIATILTGLLLFLSILALVVPFFFVLPRLQLVLYYVVDQDMGPIEAIKASWNNSKGHSAKMWGVIGVTILFAILCLVLVGLYLLFMYQAVFALMYLYVNGKQAITPATTEAPTV